MFNFGVFIALTVDGRQESHLAIIRNVPSPEVATASAWANRVVNFHGTTFTIQDATVRYLPSDKSGWLYGFRFANGDVGIGFIPGEFLDDGMIQQELPPGADFNSRFVIRYNP